jgi:hypothetical protein
MKKKAAKRKPRGPMVPAIAVGFEEAVSRLLKVKPPEKAPARRKPR